MSDLAVAMAKLAGTAKAVRKLLEDTASRNGRRPETHFASEDVKQYFSSAQRQLEVLRSHRADLFGDFSLGSIEPMDPTGEQNVNGMQVGHYVREQLQRLARDIEQVFEIRANSELAQPAAERPKRCVFISHGRAGDWREVQAYIEKDVGLKTLELAQEPNLGRTILEKLSIVSNDCDSAVIVMTGDDTDASGQAPARENVIHEIGFFQGKFGLSRICLMHEEGVNIPSNIHGLVYTPFPKGMVSAGFGLLSRELKAMYR